MQRPTHVQDPIRRLILKEDANIYQEAAYEERYESIVRRGLNTFGGKTLVEVLASPPEGKGRPRLLYFDPETDLLVGVVIVSQNAANEQKRLYVTYSAYKEFDGLRFPTKIIQQFEGDDKQVVYTIDDVIVNGDPHDFSVPESLPELKTVDAEGHGDGEEGSDGKGGDDGSGDGGS